MQRYGFVLQITPEFSGLDLRFSEFKRIFVPLKDKTLQN